MAQSRPIPDPSPCAASVTASDNDELGATLHESGAPFIYGGSVAGPSFVLGSTARGPTLHVHRSAAAPRGPARENGNLTDEPRRESFLLCSAARGWRNGREAKAALRRGKEARPVKWQRVSTTAGT